MKIKTLDPNQMTYVLNVKDFDSRGNCIFSQGDEQIRGGEVYYQPSARWERFGLNVRNRFNDNGWIEMDGNKNEWAVAFHGVREDSE